MTGRTAVPLDGRGVETEREQRGADRSGGLSGGFKTRERPEVALRSGTLRAHARWHHTHIRYHQSRPGTSSWATGMKAQARRDGQL